MIDKHKATEVLNATHGGQLLDSAEYAIVMKYWKGQKSVEKLFDRIYEKYCGDRK